MIDKIENYLGKNVLIQKIGCPTVEEVVIWNLSEDKKYFNIHNKWLLCDDYRVVGIPMKLETDDCDSIITFDYC